MSDLDALVANLKAQADESCLNKSLAETSPASYTLALLAMRLFGQAADAITALRQRAEAAEKDRQTISEALERAPSLPIETLSAEDQAKWTDTITAILMLLGATYAAMPKPSGTKPDSA